MCHNKPLFWTTSIVLALCHVDGFSDEYRVVVSRAAAKAQKLKNNSVYTATDINRTANVRSSSARAASKTTSSAAKYIQCKAGQYLPAGGSSADACKDCRKDHACAGGKWTPGSMDQGIVKCFAGYVNSKKTACTTPSAVKCNAGQYLPAGSTTCTSCKSVDSKYYCPGGMIVPSMSSFAGLKLCPSNTRPNDAKTKCFSGSAVRVACKAGTYLPAGKESCVACKDPTRYYCPGGNFAPSATSDMGLRAYNKSTTKNNDSKVGSVLSGTKHCDAGTYLPANAQNCLRCKDRKYACSGGDWTLGKPYNQGIKVCDIGKGFQPNEDKTDCEQSIVYVRPGYYLPAKSLTATRCEGDGNICPGDADYQYSTKEQGRQKCGENETANEAKTACVVTAAVCDKGYWLPAGATSCERCSGVNSYCPGGKFGVEDKDQGKKECPPSFSVNGTQSGCSIKITQRVMYNSSVSEKLDLEDQCWQMEDTAKYIKCVLGDIDKYKQ